MNSSVHDTGHLGAGPSGAASLVRGALEEAIRAVEPRAVVVRPRILRRVITQERELAGLVVRLPHRKCYVVGREALLNLVEPDELDLPPGVSVPERVILLPQPSDSKLAETPADELLLQYWRLLFHGRIHVELEERAADGRLPPEAVRERIRRIGHVEFEEIRAVLTQEAFLLPPRDDANTYPEFVAVYWELKCFAPSLLPRYFPAIDDFGRIEAILAEDVDAADVFRATRLEGAQDPDARAEQIKRRQAAEEPGADGSDEPVPDSAPEESAYRRLMRRAQEASGRGNVVRSAIHRARAERKAAPALAAKARGALKRDVDRLVRRLQVALGIEAEDPHPWQETLLALARQTPRGFWTPEARLLYDLQKVCIDHERKVYRVDVARWLLSWMREPIRRPLPAQREVAISKHLRSAQQRIPAVRLTETMRQRLTALLETATHHAEISLRERFRPMVARALDEVGLRPANVPEKVAWKKLVEELLDHVVENGFLTMGDLRDGLSRNNLKLPDISLRADWLRGDPLLRADRRLAASLDGVYRHGEFYLRWMQRLSSLAFGTQLGRLVTRYLAVPYGGTFLVVSFLDHLAEKIAGEEAAAVSVSWSLFRLVLLGTFVAGIVNVEWFRRGAWRVFVRSCRAVGDGVVRAARWIAGIEWLKRFLRSRAVRIAYRFLLKPAVFTAAAYVLLPTAVGWKSSAASGALLFLGINLFINSRVGRDVEELTVDALLQAWRRLTVPILTGLFYFFVDLFRGIMENVERVIYTVDEWLRFRSGETRLSFTAKALLGTAWSLVTYVLRFCINLLIEPQINPLKHFPVVTVSHKLLLPCIPAFAGLLAQTMEKNMAYTVATAIIFGIPGIFGFLVWELKENWRLYAANRARDLHPAVVGHHGETMGRLLRPGFHSGTVPKLFAKLRRAERRAVAGGSVRAAMKRLRAIHHVQLAVRRFLEREMLELLNHARSWQHGAVTLRSLDLSTNRIRAVLDRAAADGGPLEVAFEMRSGWLAVQVVQPGWAAPLKTAERQVLEAALLGLYRLAGVQMVGEQILAILPQAGDWDISADGLVVEPRNESPTAAYNLRQEGPLAPQTPDAQPWQTFPTLDPAQVLFSRAAFPWDQWVAFWEQERSDAGPPQEPVAAFHVLPDADGRPL